MTVFYLIEETDRVGGTHLHRVRDEISVFDTRRRAFQRMDAMRDGNDNAMSLVPFVDYREVAEAHRALLRGNVVDARNKLAAIGKKVDPKRGKK